MKISILLPDLRGGGVERIRMVLAHEFARAGHDVEFVLMQAQGQFLDEVSENFSVFDLDTSRFRTLPLRLTSYLRRRQPDVVLAAMWPLTVIAPLAVRLSLQQCKVLVSEHCDLSAQYYGWGLIHRFVLRSTMALAYRMADVRVAVSEGVAADIAVLSGLRRDAFETVHNPVKQQCAPSEVDLQNARALWSSAGGPLILSVGTLKDQKNHSLLLRAFAMMNRSEARLMLLGQGQNEGALRALARDLGIAQQVIFAGFHADPSPFYATADLFVLTSDYEGFGNVILEALSFGLPVVSTDCPSGPAEILQDGRFGHLVPVGDAHALASAMDAALSAPADAEALKRRAADFAPAIAARKYLELLGLS